MPGSESALIARHFPIILVAAYDAGFCIESARPPDGAQLCIWHIWALLMI